MQSCSPIINIIKVIFLTFDNWKWGLKDGEQNFDSTSGKKGCSKIGSNSLIYPRKIITWGWLIIISGWLIIISGWLGNGHCLNTLGCLTTCAQGRREGGNPQLRERNGHCQAGRRLSQQSGVLKCAMLCLFLAFIRRKYARSLCVVRQF